MSQISPNLNYRCKVVVGHNQLQEHRFACQTLVPCKEEGYRCMSAQRIVRKLRSLIIGNRYLVSHQIRKFLDLGNSLQA